MIDNKNREIIDKYHVCIIVPTYNNVSTLENIITELLAYTSQIIVVDDGSTDGTDTVLKRYGDKIYVTGFDKNNGKGMALRKGFEYALSKGFAYAITIDSDGQHFFEDIEVFLNSLVTNQEAIIVGSRTMDIAGIPGRSRFGHKFSNFWFRFETGINLPDTQSGYRLYPLKLIRSTKYYTRKYEFEIEVLVRSAWKGIKIISVPVKVSYLPKDERVSHFRPVIDFGRVSVLNTVLVFFAIFYFIPLRFARKSWNIKEIANNLLHESLDSKLKISSAVTVGVLCGILPIWGFQMLAAVAASTFLRLNRAITLFASNISLPPFIPIIIYLSIKTGGVVTGNKVVYSLESLKGFDGLKNCTVQYIVGGCMFAVMVSVLSGGIVFLLLHIFWNRKKA